MMRQWIRYFELILIRRLITLIEHETEPAFRILYSESLQQLMRKHTLPHTRRLVVHRLQSHVHTQSR